MTDQWICSRTVPTAAPFRCKMSNLSCNSHFPDTTEILQKSSSNHLNLSLSSSGTVTLILNISTMCSGLLPRLCRFKLGETVHGSQ